MAINKKLIHFKNFSDFNSKKLSANENNTQYTLGINGAVTNGNPDILYQSICYIKDTKQQWTHGQLYDGTNLNESGFLAGEETSDQLDDVETLTYVKYVPQTLTEEQKAQVRANIGVGTGSTGGSTGSSDITEQVLLSWGFTKNTGTYSKPSGGIPKSDLASDVQASLDKTDIIVTNKSDLDELYKDVPEGTKAVVVNTVSDVLGVNLFDFVAGNVEGMEEVFAQPEAYTLKISSVDTNVELPISASSDVSVEIPFNNKIYIEMGSDLASVCRILVHVGYSELVFHDGIWAGPSYLIDNEIPMSALLTLTDSAFIGLTTIAPALIVDFVGTKTIIEYVKNGDNWEVWSKGESGCNTKWNPEYLGNYTGTSISLDPYKIYYGAAFNNDTTITFNTEEAYGEWRIIFYISPNNSLSVPVDLWANGNIPDISAGGRFELSVVDDDGTLLGVLSEFKEL